MLYHLSYTREAVLGQSAHWPQPLSLNGGGRIRTYVGIRRQIYSLLPLAARAPHRCPHALRRSHALQLPETLSPARSGDGADEGTRTLNLLITNQLLCQLSYVSKRSFFARLSG